MVGGKKSQHTVKANVKEFSKNALSATNRAIATTISTYTPFISASLMNASTAAFDVTRFAKENNPLTRNKNRDPYVRRAINRATDAFQTSLNELRQGHLSFEETRNEISEYINENSESEWDSMAASADGEAGGAGGGSQKQFSVSDYVKGVAASSRSNVRALQVTTNKITESQYKSLNLATSKIISSNMANMQAITRQFSVTNSRIENVNANLVNLVQFNNTTMSEFIGTATEHMGKMESYLEEMLAYARLENEKRINHYNGTGAKHRSQREEEESKDFLSYGFDPGKYAKSIIDNLMETAFGPTVLTGIASGIKGIFGKVPKILADYAAGSLGEFIQQFNPLGFVIEKFMPSLKGFSSVDDIIRGTITSFFSQLGSGTYDGPFSEIARIFGIKGSTANVSRGDYNHGEAPWTGEDSRALKQVIPEYLSTIELKMSNMVDQSIINTNAIIDSIRGIQTTILQTSNKHVPENKIARITGVGQTATNSRRLYDYEAGDFTTENKIIDKLRSSLQRSASMYYDDSKDIMKAILQYADAGKMSNSSNKKALSDALTAIFMNFNAVDGETALTRDEVSALVSALQGLGIDTQSKDVKDLFGQFINKTQERRLTVNRDVGQQFQQMRNLGLGAGTNDISTDIVNHNREVIASAQNVFTLDSILRTLDDDLSNFEDFKRTDAYKNMDNETKRAYAQAVRDRDNAYMRQGVIAAILDPSKLAQNPFNVVAGTVVNSTTAVAVSLNNVVTGVSSFSEEIQNITQTIREAVLNIKSAMTGGRPDLGGLNGGGHDSGATNVPRDSVVKVHKGEIILDPALSDRVRDGIVDFINGDMSEKKFDKKVGKGLTESQVEEIKFIKQAMQSAGKLKIKKLDDVTDQIWDAAKFIDKAPTAEARLELLLRQIARNQEVGLLADNIGAIGESDRDSESLDADRRDRRLQTLRHGIGKINKDGLYEGGMLSDFANSVKGTYDKVINSLVGKAYNTYEDDGQGGKKLVHHEENQESFLKRYKNWLVKRAESVADFLGIKGKHKENISKTFDFIGENGHKLILGGLAGMVANCVLPVAIGPVLGVGAALIGSSKTLNERLFGTKDEQTGMRNDDGLISTKVTNFVKEHMFSLISGGILGMKIMKSGPVSKILGAGANHLVDGIVGILPSGGGLIGATLQGAIGMAFGPVGGALLGMGVAAMTQSEHVRKFLFGEKDDATGKRTGGLVGNIKKAFTNLGDALKDKIFGKDVEYIDENGQKVKRKDGSGLLNRVESAVYAHMLRPITTSAKYIGKYFMLWFKDDVLNTSKRIVYPILTEINLVADAVRNGLGDVIKSHVDSIKKAFEPVTKAIGTITTKLARATLSGVENIIKISLKSVSAPLKIAAGLLGAGKVGKPGLAARLFMGDARGKVNRMMFGENVRLFANELFGKGDKQFLRLDNTMTEKKKNGKAKDGLKEKLEKYLETNERLFSKFKTIGDIFKAIGNTPFGAAIKGVLNVLTHPFSVIIKNIAEGAMEGLKALVTAPFKILGLPLKGIKWVGNKLFGKESRIAKAVSNFKERAEVMKSGGSAAGATSELTRQFAKTFNVLNKSITKRTEQDGLLVPGQQQLVDANLEHKKLKSDKKALEKQHRRDKALDSYISKLNLQMSPAEFDALPAAKRNEIIRKLVHKSGNKDIAKWDEEKIRALVTGGRGKVEKLEGQKKDQDNATKNMANLPDTLKENTEKITDKLQEIYDALIGKVRDKTSGDKTSTHITTADGTVVKRTAEEISAFSQTSKASATGKYDVKAIDVSKTVASSMDYLSQQLTDDAFGNSEKREEKAHEIINEMAKSMHLNLDLVDDKTKTALINDIKTALKGKGKDRDKALNRIKAKLSTITTKFQGEMAQSKAASEMTDKLTNLKQKLINKYGVKTPEPVEVNPDRIKSWFEFDKYDDLIDHGKGTGRYNIDANGKLVVAPIDPETGKHTGQYDFKGFGKFKKWVRDKRDGTMDAINPDGTLNYDGMNGLQLHQAKKVAVQGALKRAEESGRFNGMGFFEKRKEKKKVKQETWDDEKKKPKGDLEPEEKQDIKNRLKFFSSDQASKLMSSVVGKVIKGVFSVGTFLVGLGLFTEYIFPKIKEPLMDVLYGKDGKPGVLSSVKQFFVGKGEENGNTEFEKGGIFRLVKNALVGKGDAAGEDATEFEKTGLVGVIGGGLKKGITFLGEKLPTWFAKGAELAVNVGKMLLDALKSAVDYFFDQEAQKKKAKDNNTAGAKSLQQYFTAAENKEKTDAMLSNGKTINIVDENGNINFENLKTLRNDYGYTEAFNSEATTDDYKVKVAFAQFGIPLEIWSSTGNVNDAKVRQSGKYFVLADNIGRHNILGLSSDQISSLRSLKTKDGKKVDGYLFILIDIIGTTLVNPVTTAVNAVSNAVSDTSVGHAQWAIYPAIWNETTEVWKVSPTRCGFCTQGLTKTGKKYDSDISTENIDSTDGTWSYYNDMRQEVKSTYVAPPEPENDEKSAGSGRGSIGYGHFTQNDPRWAKLGYGKMRSGSMSTMADGGCGPTAMANAINNVYGRNVTNPLTIANYASKNGYSVDGGTSAGLFNRGAKGLGVNSSAISKSGSSIANQLRHGKNVIVAGRGGSAYTSAGHIMSVRGIDRGGNAIVDDPMRRKSRHIPMNKLTRGMTHAWSIGRGPDSDAYYGTSPDGSNYAFLSDYLTALGNNPTYYDTSSATPKSIGGTISTNGANNGSIIWGYNDSYDAACFVKSIASAVYNLYAKKKGLNRDTSAALISNLGSSYAQPHTLQRTGKYGANTGGYVTDYSALANNVYSALNDAGGAISTNGISLTEGRDLDPKTQKSTILSNLSAGKPVIIHINNAGSLTSAYRKSVFGRIDGAARTEHAVLLNNLVTAGNSKYVLIGDPGSAQSSNNGGTTSGAQIRLVNFDQLTDPLANSKLNHLLTINDGGSVPMLEVTAPNPEAAMGASTKATVSTSDAASSNSDDTIGINTTDTSKSKFSSFTDWLSGLVQHVAKIGSALLSAIFSGKSFKEVWAEMNPSKSSGGDYTYSNSTNPVYNPTTYMANASDEYKAAYEMVARYDNNALSRGAISSSNIKNGLKFVNYNSEKYEDFTLSKANVSDETTVMYGDKLISQFAADLLGMAIYYIKEHTPKAIDGNFKKYCILVANLFSKNATVNKIYKQYKSGKYLFKDEDGFFMFVALCFEKMLMPGKDAEKCGKLFMKSVFDYENAGGKFSDTSEGAIGFGADVLAALNGAIASKEEEKKKENEDKLKNKRKAAIEGMKNAAANSAVAVNRYMHDNYLIMTYSVAKKIISEQQEQSAQVGEYAATSSGNSTPYTGEWAPTNQPWVDDPTYTKNLTYNTNYAKPDTNYDTATSGISNTYQPGYFHQGFTTMQSPDYATYGRQLTRDLRTFPTINVDKMNQVIQSVAPHSPFVGHGQSFINASNMTGLDPLYIFSQTWESGFGTAGQSHLNKGNYHGLTAYEGTHGYAFLKDGVATIDSGIMGGAQILANRYINRPNPHQNNILALCDAGHCYNSETSQYANTNASYLAQAEAAAGFGIGGNGGVNIHDAMMNTPTSDIYTRDDDVYMGDANHPMNVKMDTTPTTSRLDVIISLLGELLKGDNSLPPATSKATESVAGYGEGKSKSSNNTIVVANQNKKPDKANTNMKRDRLRSVYDQISKRALTYTH